MSSVNYDKIKHLVEVEDDILAVFTVTSGRDCHIENLSIAKNAGITKDFLDNIFAKLKDNLRNIKDSEIVDNTVGRLKWTIHETDRIRTLMIYEKDLTVIVLIKSNISLSETVDNLLGYYYESENTLRDLFR